MGHVCGLCMGVNSDRCPNNPENSDGVEKVVRYFAFDLRTRRDVEVTEATWLCLPPDEDMAEALGKRYCRQDIENIRPADIVCLT